MATFKFTKLAVNDLSEIWDYTLEIWSEKQAIKYYKWVIDTCSEIARKPEMGKDYSQIYPNLQGQKISKHIIFYRIMEDKSIEITRILHDKMDLKSKF